MAIVVSTAARTCRRYSDSAWQAGVSGPLLGRVLGLFETALDARVELARLDDGCEIFYLKAVSM